MVKKDYDKKHRIKLIPTVKVLTLTQHQLPSNNSFVSAMPDTSKLSQMIKGKFSLQKQLLLNEISHNSMHMEGILAVNESHGRH